MQNFYYAFTCRSQSAKQMFYSFRCCYKFCCSRSHKHEAYAHLCCRLGPLRLQQWMYFKKRCTPTYLNNNYVGLFLLMNRWTKNARWLEAVFNRSPPTRWIPPNFSNVFKWHVLLCKGIRLHHSGRKIKYCDNIHIGLPNQAISKWAWKALSFVPW